MVTAMVTAMVTSEPPRWYFLDVKPYVFIQLQQNDAEIPPALEYVRVCSVRLASGAGRGGPGPSNLVV